MTWALYPTSNEQKLLSVEHIFTLLLSKLAQIILLPARTCHALHGDLLNLEKQWPLCLPNSKNSVNKGSQGNGEPVLDLQHVGYFSQTETRLDFVLKNIW